MRLVLQESDGDLPTLAALEMTPDVGDFASAAASLERRCRAVGVPLAGGTAQILGDPAVDKSPELFAEVAREVDLREGRVLLMQGMGIDGSDMAAIREGTPHVLGLPAEVGGSGDPSPFTALGAFAAIRACLGELSGKRISVLGVGRVGSRLVALLADAGATVTVADLDAEVARRVAEAYGTEVAPADELLTLEGDLLSPNGRGQVLDLETVDALRYRFVAGAANGQVADPRVEERLAERGIAYVPEILAGSGWLVNLAAELHPGGYDPQAAGKMCLSLYARVRQYLERGGLMLSFEQVSLTRRNPDGEVPVLREVSFEVPAREVFAILGPSGSGKSTILRLACRLDDPDAGRISLEGRDLRDMDVLALRRRVGFLFQEPALFGASVEENLRFAADPTGGGAPGADVGRRLEQVGLETSLLSRDPDALSLGQKQRVALARALVAEPEVLLLDEPTSALDPQATTGILALVRELRDRLDLTVVFVTHIVDHARVVADRALVLRDGEVLEAGGAEILVNPERQETRAFLEGEEE